MFADIFNIKNKRHIFEERGEKVKQKWMKRRVGIQL